MNLDTSILAIRNNTDSTERHFFVTTRLKYWRRSSPLQVVRINKSFEFIVNKRTVQTGPGLKVSDLKQKVMLTLHNKRKSTLIGVRSHWKALQGQQASVTAVCVSTTTSIFPVPTQAVTDAPQDLRA